MNWAKPVSIWIISALGDEESDGDFDLVWELEVEFGDEYVLFVTTFMLVWSLGVLGERFDGCGDSLGLFDVAEDGVLNFRAELFRACCISRLGIPEEYVSKFFLPTYTTHFSKLLTLITLLLLFIQLNSNLNLELT